MTKWFDKLAHSQVSRRDFLKGSAAATAAVAGLSLAGCGNVVDTTTEAPDETTKAPVETTAPGVEYAPIVDPEEGGKWISAACWHNCGGRCMNKVMVKDGIVIRQKTDDTHEDSFDYPQQRGCVRGKAQQQQCFGADRIKYPMKRKNWSPENPNGHLRGEDEWERISWDEAIKYVADEYTKIKAKYGPEAFLTCNYGSMGADVVLNALGGHTSTADSSSHGVYLLNTAKTIGLPSYGSNRTNDRMDMLNADYVILHAANPAWSAAGTPSYHFIRAKEKGVKFITIDPIYTQSAQMLDAEWVPIRTGTDTALFLAIAHEMLRLDAQSGDIIDWDFLNKYTVGFDADHKPADLKEDVNTRDYIEGKYDGIVKDAAWASKITGVPVDQITMLATVLGKKNNVWMLQNFGAARNNGAENLPQAFLMVGCMGGHFAKKGNCVACNYHANAGNGGPALVGSSAKKYGAKETTNTIEYGYLREKVIPAPQVWDACLGAEYTNVGQFYGSGVTAGTKQKSDIHCICHTIQAAFLQTGPNQKKGIEAHRKMDFVVSKAQFMTVNAQYSDIILPVAAEWEKPGGVTSSNREFLICYSQITEPLFESKTDQEINSLLLEALGFDPIVAYPRDPKQSFFNSIAGAWVLNWETGERETLCTITQADIDAWGVEGEPQEGKIPMQQFIDNGGYQVERKEGDKQSEYMNHAAFIADPEANPMKSPSGKFELCCQSKADLFNSFGLVDYDFKPYPEYLVGARSYETTFKNNDINGEKGEYPFLLFNPHYIRRSHSVFNNCPWLREAHENPVFLNASDAKAKGIANGDTVRVWTEFGSVLRHACLMETLVPGQVGIPHGSWANVDHKTGIDHGGSDNYLLGNVISASGVTGYNNNNCNYEKYTAVELPRDCEINDHDFVVTE